MNEKEQIFVKVLVLDKISKHIDDTLQTSACKKEDFDLLADNIEDCTGVLRKLNNEFGVDRISTKLHNRKTQKCVDEGIDEDEPKKKKPHKGKKLGRPKLKVMQRVMRQVRKPVLREHRLDYKGLSVHAEKLLLALKGSSKSERELANELFLDPEAVHKQVENLKKWGWLKSNGIMIEASPKIKWNTVGAWRKNFSKDDSPKSEGFKKVMEVRPDSVQEKVLTAIENGATNYSSIAEASGINPNTLGTTLSQLVFKEKIKRVGKGEYALTEEN